MKEKPNCRHRISEGLELIDKEIIGKYLSAEYRNTLKNTVVFDELPSTNTYLTELKWDGAIRICLAESQTAGKGRLGRKWISPYAKNIYLSLACEFSHNPVELGSLSLVVAVAVLKALKIYGVKNDVWLKWPNDILWQQRKLAGILIEIAKEARHIYKAVIGVGINLAMPIEQGVNIDQSWCDISQITNEIPQRNKLIGIVLDQLLTAITNYKKHGFVPFIKEWEKADVCYGKSVKIIMPTKVICGIGRGINEHGHFLFEDESGEIHAFVSGEVSVRL